MEAKQTIERINRGQFRIQIVQHGEGGKNREIQVVDTVHNFMVKGVTEQALIAHILLDSRTAVKHFEAVKGGKDLDREIDMRENPDRLTGFQRVLAENEGKLSKPKSTRKPWPKLRPPKSMEQIQNECAEAERREKEEAEQVTEVVEEAETVISDEVDPIELASIWEFEDGDAKGTFIGIATAFGSAAVESYLGKNAPDGVMTSDFINLMGESLSDEHVEGSEVEIIDESKKAKRPEAETFDPEKKTSNKGS